MSAQNAALTDDVTNSNSPLLQERHVYKPFLYPWCYEAWLTQQRVHWLPEEVPMAQDVHDWKKTLTPAEKNLMTQIFRFFTQADVEVNNCYMKHYAQVFGPVEVQMMLSAFSNIETIHIAAYSHLLDTLGMPEVEYQAFLKYKEMKDKYDYMQTASMKSRRDIAKTMALFSGFTEGVQLFASFAILMNFPRFNKMKGMGQIMTWSVRDETLHCLSMIKLFKTFISENPDIWDDELKAEITASCRKVIEIEDNFIDLAFEMGGIEGLEPQEVKNYIRWISDRRLQQLDLEPINAQINKNPLPWMDEMLCMLDSGDVTDAHRESMVQSITSNTADKFIICHGTNTLIETAQYLAAHFLIKDTDKTIILTGAIIPLKQFILSDGGFNLGYAVGQSYNLSSGVHICMHGKIFLPQNVTKNRAEARFEEL